MCAKGVQYYMMRHESKINIIWKKKHLNEKKVIRGSKNVSSWFRHKFMNYFYDYYYEYS